MGLFCWVQLSAQKSLPKPATMVKLASKNDSIQYVLGAFVGLFILNNNFPLSGASPLFVKGVEDIVQNRARPLADSVIGPWIAHYQEKAQKTKSVQEEQQLFASLKDKPGVGVFPSGVRYVVTQAGTGARVSSPADSITVQMIAKLPDGTVVEDTYRSQPFEATPTSFVPGLVDVLQMMNEGSKWQVFVPASLAYGEKGTWVIPPNTALVIELELVRVRKK